MRKHPSHSILLVIEFTALILLLLSLISLVNASPTFSNFTYSTNRAGHYTNITITINRDAPTPNDEWWISYYVEEWINKTKHKFNSNPETVKEGIPLPKTINYPVKIIFYVKQNNTIYASPTYTIKTSQPKTYLTIMFIIGTPIMASLISMSYGGRKRWRIPIITGIIGMMTSIILYQIYDYGWLSPQDLMGFTIYQIMSINLIIWVISGLIAEVMR